MSSSFRDRLQQSISQLERTPHLSGKVGSVSHHYQSDLFFLIELDQELSEFRGGDAIQGPRRLVGEQKSGSINQRTNDSGALALPARKLSWTMMEPFSQPHSIEQQPGPLLGGSVHGGVRGQCRNEHILPNRAVGEEVMRLKDETDPSVPDTRQGRVVERSQVLILEQNLSLIGSIQGSE